MASKLKMVVVHCLTLVVCVKVAECSVSYPGGCLKRGNNIPKLPTGNPENTLYLKSRINYIKNANGVHGKPFGNYQGCLPSTNGIVYMEYRLIDTINDANRIVMDTTSKTFYVTFNHYCSFFRYDPSVVAELQSQTTYNDGCYKQSVQIPFHTNFLKQKTNKPLVKAIQKNLNTAKTFHNEQGCLPAGASYKYIYIYDKKRRVRQYVVWDTTTNKYFFTDDNYCSFRRVK